MYLELIDELDKESMLCDELFNELFEIELESKRIQYAEQLKDRADKLKCKTAFNKLYKAKLKEFNETLPTVQEEFETDFSTLDDQLICGNWHCDDYGIWIHSDRGKIFACHHPIYPTRILKNAELGTYKTELEYVIRGHVRKTIVDRSTLASKSKILALANNSIQVTDNNAAALVQYLSDIEMLNPDRIKEMASTSRLGFITRFLENGEAERYFLPYDQDVVFDNELNTKALFDSIREVGDRSKWYEAVKEIRARRQNEVLINLASSYASVLVEPCGALPFIVSLWGGTGIGKTVVLMLATSIWADPSEGQYMSDAKATQTAMEIRLNILNSLPMTIDDMAQIKNHQDEDFSQLIYRWCAGKGRDRSNVNLGLNKLTSWKNCTITNGERSLVDESTQGGAVNRVIDIESDGSVLFDGAEGNRVSNLLRENFGFSGREFVELITRLGDHELINIKNKYFDLIKEIAKEEGVEKEDKQIMPMALILTADELTEKYLFKDGVRLDAKECCRYLKNKGEVSEHKRAYEYLVDNIFVNKYHFAPNSNEELDSNVAVWGFWTKETLKYKSIAINPSIFDGILKDGGFQPKAFKSWAKKEGLLEANGERLDKLISINGTKRRFIVIKIEKEDEFVEVDDDIEVPF